LSPFLFFFRTHKPYYLRISLQNSSGLIKSKPLSCRLFPIPTNMSS
jgi:hypothetical protein